MNRVKVKIDDMMELLKDIDQFDEKKQTLLRQIAKKIERFQKENEDTKSKLASEESPFVRPEPPEILVNAMSDHEEWELVRYLPEARQYSTLTNVWCYLMEWRLNSKKMKQSLLDLHIN